MAVVKGGASIIVPPNYGHCSITIGDGPLVFSNSPINPARFTTTRCSFTTVWPAIVKRTGKWRARITTTTRVFRAHQICHRQRGTRILASPSIRRFINAIAPHRKRFHFLGHVDNYVREIMGMLQYEDDLFRSVRRTHDGNAICCGVACTDLQSGDVAD